MKKPSRGLKKLVQNTQNFARELSSRLYHFLFVQIAAQRAALHFKHYLPGLGMVENEKLVLASQTRTSGLVFVSGFMIPKLEYETFMRTAEGWKPRKVVAVISKTGELQELDEKGDIHSLSFSNPIAEPIVQLLKACYPVFPFTHYNISTQAQIEERRPPLKG